MGPLVSSRFDATSDSEASTAGNILGGRGRRPFITSWSTSPRRVMLPSGLQQQMVAVLGRLDDSCRGHRVAMT
jgi:hypothetical protein